MSRRSIVDILSDPAVTPDLLAQRVTYWRVYADRFERLGRVQQAAIVRSNCLIMEALAERMVDEPEPCVKAVVSRPAKKPSRKSATVGAEAFWALLNRARDAARAEIGNPWWARSADDCVWLRVPARLASFRGPLGTLIRYPRDVHAPAARFWPGGAIPEGPEVRPDYARAPYPRQGMTEAQWREHERREAKTRQKPAMTHAARKSKLDKLAAMTVDRGCTPAEAATAAALASRITSNVVAFPR